MAIENRKNLFSQNTGVTTGAAKTNSERRVVSWPDREEVWKYCEELDSAVDPDKFFDYYDNRQWQTASGPVYDWKALFRAWDKKEYRRTPKKQPFSHRFGDDPVTPEALEDFMNNSESLLNRLRKGGANGG